MFEKCFKIFWICCIKWLFCGLMFHGCMLCYWWAITYMCWCRVLVPIYWCWISYIYFYWVLYVCMCCRKGFFFLVDIVRADRDYWIQYGASTKSEKLLLLVDIEVVCVSKCGCILLYDVDMRAEICMFEVLSHMDVDVMLGICIFFVICVLACLDVNMLDMFGVTTF